jgi:hypothetical protein
VITNSALPPNKTVLASPDGTPFFAWQQWYLGVVNVYAAAAPTTGAHVVGEIVWNSAPASAGFIGWVCVTAGTPGTWKTWGLIS